MSKALREIPIRVGVLEVETWSPARSPGSLQFDYVDISSIDRDTKSITSAAKISAGSAPSRARQLVRSGDVLVSTVRPNLNAVAMVPPILDGATASTGFTVLRPNPELLDGRYLYHWVRTEGFVQRMVERATGASYPAVTDRIVKESSIPCPPLNEQQSIAAILDKADALREKRRQAIAKLDELVQAVFLEMFGDPVTNPKDWDTRAVEQLCTLVRGSSPRPKSDPRYYGGTVPRLMVADLTRDGWFVTPRIDSLTEAGARLSRPIEAGTVVMAVSGNVGATARLMIDACIHDGFVAFKDLEEELIRPTYLMITLHHLRITHERRKAGAIFQNLTTDDVKAMEIPIPHVGVQDRIERILRRAYSVRARSETSNCAHEALFQSLQRGAFSGELFGGGATLNELDGLTEVG